MNLIKIVFKFKFESTIMYNNKNNINDKTTSDFKLNNGRHGTEAPSRPTKTPHRRQSTAQSPALRTMGLSPRNATTRISDCCYGYAHKEDVRRYVAYSTFPPP